MEPAQSLDTRMADASEAERPALLLDLVRSEVADVLGLPGPDSVPADRALRSLGIDSLTMVQLRKRLAKRLNTTLPATLVFDYPTAEAIAGLLLPRRHHPEREREVKTEALFIAGTATYLPPATKVEQAVADGRFDAQDAEDTQLESVCEATDEAPPRWRWPLPERLWKGRVTGPRTSRCCCTPACTSKASSSTPRLPTSTAKCSGTTRRSPSRSRTPPTAA
ncbi:hypothetical protein SMICM304S_07254 [Streptomyces microflavus]